MKHDIPVKNGITIPEHELEIKASKSGGAGGQHVNKTSTRITVRWNIKNTIALNKEQKKRVLQKLQTQISKDGDLVVHNSESRSQQQNKKNALAQLIKLVRKGLFIPKKRIKTKVPKTAKEARLRKKAHRSEIKKMRSKQIKYE
jgi:ribosome-associated protein